MRHARQIYLGIVLLTAVPPSRCGNECDFLERCQGNVRQTCGEGVDQCWNRHVREEPCVSPNDACAAVGGGTTCARAPITACGPAYVPTCEGRVLLECSSSPEGVVVAVDCSMAGQTCGAGPSGRAACVQAP